jgi:hypothetical protein
VGTRRRDREEVTVVAAEESPVQEDPPDDSYIVVLLAKGGARLQPGQGLQLNQLHTDAGPARLVLSTRYQEVGRPERLPQELIFEVHCQGTDLDDAVRRAAVLATSLTSLISFTVNAFVDQPLPTMAWEGSPGRSSRRFWQAKVELGAEFPTPARLLRDDLLFPVLSDVFTHVEFKRLARAISHYHAALRSWTVAAQPLALVHLYPALEALGPATERAERQRLGLPDEHAHAVHRGVDVTESNWREVLLGWVRRDVICQSDAATYRTAYKADGERHSVAPAVERLRASTTWVAGRPRIEVAADLCGVTRPNGVERLASIHVRPAARTRDVKGVVMS